MVEPGPHELPKVAHVPVQMGDVPGDPGKLQFRLVLEVGQPVGVFPAGLALRLELLFGLLYPLGHLLELCRVVPDFGPERRRREPAGHRYCRHSHGQQDLHGTSPSAIMLTLPPAGCALSWLPLTATRQWR